MSLNSSTLQKLLDAYSDTKARADLMRAKVAAELLSEAPDMAQGMLLTRIALDRRVILAKRKEQLAKNKLVVNAFMLNGTFDLQAAGLAMQSHQTVK